jgi:hypothetical protein
MTVSRGIRARCLSAGPRSGFPANGFETTAGDAEYPHDRGGVAVCGRDDRHAGARYRAAPGRRDHRRRAGGRWPAGRCTPAPPIVRLPALQQREDHGVEHDHNDQAAEEVATVLLCPVAPALGLSLAPAGKRRLSRRTWNGDVPRPHVSCRLGAASCHSRDRNNFCNGMARRNL